VDPNWPRWIAASLARHFDAELTLAGLPMYLEGQDRRTDRLTDYAEFRYTGPRITELSKDYWQLDVDVDVLVVSKTSDSNIYTPEAGVGVVLAAFTPDIPVFRYGKGPQDDPDDQLGCLRMVPQTGGVLVTNFGPPKDQVRLRQASVEATYRMNLST
jgi:hypothetical protein